MWDAKLSSNSTKDFLSMLYEDNDIVVMLAPHEDELEKIITEILKKEKKPLTVKEIHKYLEAIASEEKIRRTLYKLSSKNIVKHYKDGKYEYVGFNGERR